MRFYTFVEGYTLLYLSNNFQTLNFSLERLVRIKNVYLHGFMSFTLQLYSISPDS